MRFFDDQRRTVLWFWWSLGLLALLAMSCWQLVQTPESNVEATSDRSGQWELGGSVPGSLITPLPADGSVVSSYQGADQIIVMLSYDQERESELIGFYERWAAWSRPEPAITNDVIVIERAELWTRRWDSPQIQVRLTQCINPLTNQFTLVCVAVTERANP